MPVRRRVCSLSRVGCVSIRVLLSHQYSIGDHGYWGAGDSPGRLAAAARAADQVLFEDRYNTFIGTGPERERPSTRRFEALGTVAFAEPHEPQTGPESLLGMRPGGENSFDHLGRCRATGRCPVDQALGCPC